MHSAPAGENLDGVTWWAKLLVCTGVLVAAGVIVVATGPHPWIGRTLCEIRGGEWTGGFRPRAEVVTAGYLCSED